MSCVESLSERAARFGLTIAREFQKAGKLGGGDKQTPEVQALATMLARAYAMGVEDERAGRVST